MDLESTKGKSQVLRASWRLRLQVWKLVLDVLTTLLQNLERALECRWTFTSTRHTAESTSLFSSWIADMPGMDVQLTDRETQILVPNIVERSGHNILVIRESMQELLRPELLPMKQPVLSANFHSLAIRPRRICASVASRGRVLPMLLHGLTSKSKRRGCQNQD